MQVCVCCRVHTRVSNCVHVCECEDWGDVCVHVVVNVCTCVCVCALVYYMCVHMWVCPFIFVFIHMNVYAT